MAETYHFFVLGYCVLWIVLSLVVAGVLFRLGRLERLCQHLSACGEDQKH